MRFLALGADLLQVLVINTLRRILCAARYFHLKRPLPVAGSDGIELMQSVPGLADLPVIFISA